jgi:hypothetical protein
MTRDAWLGDTMTAAIAFRFSRAAAALSAIGSLAASGNGAER